MNVGTLVFGEALVDEFPAEQVVGGAPFNVARHLAAFMAPPLVITRIGDDRNGAAVRAELERFAMLEGGVQVDPMEETGRVVVERNPQGHGQGAAHRFHILPRQAYDFIDARAAVASLGQAATTAGMIYFGTLAQRSEPSRLALAAVLDATPARRFLDLNLRPGQADEALVTRALTAADIVKVNEAELQALFGWYFQIGPDTPPPGTAEVHAACRALVDRFGLEALIVTLRVLRRRWQPRRASRQSGAAVRDRHERRGRRLRRDLPARPCARLAARAHAGARQRIRRRDLRGERCGAARHEFLRQVGGTLEVAAPVSVIRRSGSAGSSASRS
jgi:fructokinase